MPSSEMKSVHKEKYGLRAIQEMLQWRANPSAGLLTTDAQSAPAPRTGSLLRDDAPAIKGDEEVLWRRTEEVSQWPVIGVRRQTHLDPLPGQVDAQLALLLAEGGKEALGACNRIRK